MAPHLLCLHCVVDYLARGVLLQVRSFLIIITAVLTGHSPWGNFPALSTKATIELLVFRSLYPLPLEL